MGSNMSKENGPSDAGCSSWLTSRFNEPYPFLMPSNRAHQIFLFCFAKSVGEMDVNAIDGFCHGCQAGSLSQKSHRECLDGSTYANGPLTACRVGVYRHVAQLCQYEGVPVPAEDSLQMLWGKCQNEWRGLVRTAVLRDFDMFPMWWETYI